MKNDKSIKILGQQMYLSLFKMFFGDRYLAMIEQCIALWSGSNLSSGVN